jgi:quercetin dioxygenase-like cupin family protein
MAEEYKDAVAVAPEVYRVLFENDKVRVLDVTVAPGAGTDMHSHPEYLVYTFTQLEMKFTEPDGKSENVSIPANVLSPLQAGPHVAENVGTNEAHALMIELK